jgi:hypothetical protein
MIFSEDEFIFSGVEIIFYGDKESFLGIKKVLGYKRIFSVEEKDSGTHKFILDKN